MYYDMHVHSEFSTDSHMTMTEAIHSALKKNLSGIAFTDHIDLDFVGHESEFQFNIPEYFEHINLLIEQYKGRLDILRAVEFGIQEHVIEETRQLIQGFSYDFILGSTHLFRRKDPYEPDFFPADKSKTELYRDCLACIYHNIKLYYDFDVLAHLDYQVRNAPYKDPAFYYGDYSDIIDEIFRYIIGKGIGLEVNTSTYKVVPMDEALLVRYRELGGEILTLGSDAHYAENVAQLFGNQLAFIKHCGFRYIAHYKNRKPAFDIIDI